MITFNHQLCLCIRNFIPQSITTQTSKNIKISVRLETFIFQLFPTDIFHQCIPWKSWRQVFYIFLLPYKKSAEAYWLLVFWLETVQHIGLAWKIFMEYGKWQKNWYFLFFISCCVCKCHFLFFHFLNSKSNTFFCKKTYLVKSYSLIEPTLVAIDEL